METYTKVFSYLRVSGKSQIDGDGFPRQRLAIQAFAAANKMVVVQEFAEEAITGKAEWDERPAWVRMMNSMNGVRTIIVEKLDRLARDLMVQEHVLADLAKRGITLISAAEPDLCIDDPYRKLVRQIMGAISSYDRAMITAKLSGARKRMKERTGRCEGVKPYGMLEGEQPALDFMRSWRREQESYGHIARRLNDAGYVSRHGKAWTYATVGKILAREERAERRVA